MAQQPLAIEFEDVPLDEARLTIPEGTCTTAMKNRILRVVRRARTPLTVRKVPGGILF